MCNKTGLDLISRSALLAAIQTDVEEGGLGGMVAGALKRYVKRAPAVEAKPVRHGYWENANGRPKTYIRKCSVCGKEAYFCGRGCSYKFCPNCRAKMDKEE